MKFSKKMYKIYLFGEKELLRQDNGELFVGESVITERGLFGWDNNEYAVFDIANKKITLIGNAEEVNKWFGYEVIRETANGRAK